MTLLICGILVFTLVHLSLGIAPGIKNSIITSMGEKTWRGIFSVLAIGSILMIILGWRSAPVEYAYVPPHGLRHVTMLLMLIAFVLFGAAKGVTDIQRYVRHPMMTAVLIWAIAHLLSNGETRSLLLFGSFLVWVVLQIFFANRRDGEWVKPEPAPMTRTLKNMIISILMFVVFAALHKYFAGVSLVPSG